MSPHPLGASLFRISTADGRTVGCGVLISLERGCTCAHVIQEALGRGETGRPSAKRTVMVDFPFLVGRPQAVLVADEPPPAEWAPASDLAVMDLRGALPSGAAAARLLRDPRPGGPVEFYGFPHSVDGGAWVEAELRERRADGTWQLEAPGLSGYPPSKGFSGAPVWSREGHGVAGLLAAVDAEPSRRVAVALSSEAIAERLSGVALSSGGAQRVLTEGLGSLPGDPVTGFEQFLDEYMGRGGETVPFGGREDVLAALDAWLEDPTSDRALLVARAGRGKSALLARWASALSARGGARIAFVPISIRFGTARQSAVLGLLGARLRWLTGRRRREPSNVDEWLAEIGDILRQSASDHASPLVIVLDGIDEASDWSVGRDLRFPPNLGAGVKVVVSARKIADKGRTAWREQLEWSSVEITDLALRPLNREDVAAVLRSMGEPLDGLAEKDAIAGELERLSEGDPLLVRLYVEALRGEGARAAFLEPADLRALEPGLSGYFNRWWEDATRSWPSDATRAHAMYVLHALACGLSGLTREDLVALSDSAMLGWQVDDGVAAVRRFIVGEATAPGYVLSHPRLTEYFREERLSGPERDEWDARFADYGRLTLRRITAGELPAASAPDYALRYHSAHLERSGAERDQYFELVSEAWFRAWDASEETYEGFGRDVERAWRAADEVVVDRGAPAAMRSEARDIQRACALVIASLNTLATKLPPEVVVTLVRNGTWRAGTALAWARRATDQTRRTTILAGVTPYLPGYLLDEAIWIARSPPSPDLRAALIRGLAGRFTGRRRGELLDEAWAVADEIADRNDRWPRQVSIVSARGDDDSALTRLIELVARDGSDAGRLGLVRALEAPLSEGTYAGVVDLIQGFKGGDARAEALGAILDRCSARQVEGVLPLIRQVSTPRLMFTLLRRAGRLMSDAQIDHALHRSGSREFEVLAASLVPQLDRRADGPEVEAALRGGRRSGDPAIRARALCDIAPLLPGDRRGIAIRDAIELALKERTIGLRLEALIVIAHCGAVGARELAIAAADDVTRPVRVNARVAVLLSRIAEGGSEAGARRLLERAAGGARGIALHSRSRTLCRIAESYPDDDPAREGLLGEALTAARAIGDATAQTTALAVFAPERVAETVASERWLLQDWEHAPLALHAVARTLAPEAAARAMATAIVLPVDATLNQAIGALAERLDPTDLAAVFDRAASMRNLRGREAAFVAVCFAAPEETRPTFIRRALNAARRSLGVHGEAELAGKLLDLLPRAEQRDYTLSLVTSADWLFDYGERSGVLVRLVTRLDASDWHVIAELVRNLHDPHVRSEVMTALIPGATPERRDQLIAECVRTARKVQSGGQRAVILAQLLRHMAAGEATEILEEAKRSARKAPSSRSRVEALVAVADVTPTNTSAALYDEAAKAAIRVRGATERASCLSAVLASETPGREELGHEALVAIRGVSHEMERASLLARVTPFLPRGCLLSAAELTANCELSYMRHAALARLGERLVTEEEGLRDPTLSRAMRHSGRRSRAALLIDIVMLEPAIAAQDPHAAQQTAGAVTAVCDWFP